MRIRFNLHIGLMSFLALIQWKQSSAINNDSTTSSSSSGLRRKRNVPAESISITRKAVSQTEFRLDSGVQMRIAPDDHFEDLWNKAMAVDERMKFDERWLLLSFSNSMPNRPSPPSPQQPSGSALPSAIPSFDPSQEDCLSDTTRDEYLLSILTKVVDEARLSDSSTPQGLAYKWLSESDPLDPNPCSYPTLLQRYGLATFFYATGGDKWKTSDKWLGDSNECEWYGVTCGGSKKNMVERLQLPLNGVEGTIPDEISILYEMRRIDLFGNTLGGKIPTGVENLTQLELLDLEENELSGIFFTPEVMTLTNLIALRGSFNSFTGTIPSDISKLKHLEQLWFADNSLEGTIPKSITELSSLDSLFGYSNMLEKTIPKGFGSLVNFTQIRLYQNMLTGELPPDIFDATNLDTIRLDSNQLTGSIPTTIGKLSRLEDLRLYSNAIFGTIPTEISKVLTLKNLLLNNNFLSGTIAPDIFNPKGTLTFVDISNNQFLGGSLPLTLFELPSLVNLYISNCSLTGTIPTTFSMPPNLNDLYLDGNKLKGTVPDVSSGKFEKLNEFLLHNNDLSGSMPESICALRDTKVGNLEDLWSDCQGKKPEVICDFPGCCNRCF